MTLRGLLQWKRLTLLIFLSIVPLLGVIVFRTVGVPRIEQQSEIIPAYLKFEFFGVLVYFSSIVAPLTILLLATGMIRDEQENQTLTYLMMCPIPRWRSIFPNCWQRSSSAGSSPWFAWGW
ncbi:MAG: ABC transporter permease [Gemmatales bacterium]